MCGLMFCCSFLGVYLLFGVASYVSGGIEGSEEDP
jgi:hypothetical protein